MTKADKKDQKIRGNPKNIKFQDLVSWLEDNGFSLDRVKGKGKPSYFRTSRYRNTN